MDSLAARGVRFARTVAESSWTLPSHMTLFTGLHPTSHGVTLQAHRLADDVPTLAALLHKQGYRTFGYSAGGVLVGKFGFDRGFEVYDDSPKSLRDSVDLAVEQIRRTPVEDPYFLFLHTYDVHCPYDPPHRYASMFRTRPRADRLETEGRCGNPYFNGMTLSAGQVKFLSDQYDAGIRAADDDLKHLFDALNQRDEWGRSIVVLLSDHGEELEEHGQIGHERTLFVESLMIPLIIAAPGVKPAVISEGVGLVDVMPTLLKMLNIPAPPMQGLSLVPLMSGQTANWDRRPLFSELDRFLPLRSVMLGKYHYIVNIDPDKPIKMRYVFDLSADPTEQVNLADRDYRMTSQLADLQSAHDRSLSRQRAVPRAELSPEEKEQIRALGYVD
jgi:arylsulfatase A-like enzyme